MEKTESVSHRNASTDLLAPATWQTMWNQANVLVKSGFLPNAVKTPEQAIAIMMKGYEIGIPVMQSFSHINVIQGKPTCSAELQMALILKNCPQAKINFTMLDDNGCTISASRPGWKSINFKFDKHDAEISGLLSKDNWKKWPRAMYRSRCIAEMARTMFSDAIMGMSYTHEELNPDVEMDDDGHIVEVPPIAPTYIPPQEESMIAFDMNNEAHLTKLEKILAEKHISKDSWLEYIEKMHGQPFRRSVIEALLMGT